MVIVALDMERGLNSPVNLFFQYQIRDTIFEDVTLKCSDTPLRDKSYSRFLFE